MGDLDSYKRTFSFDETDDAKKRPISPARHLNNTNTDERVTFSLEKDILDDDKDEIVYISAARIINRTDEDEQTSGRTVDDSTNSSLEQTSDEEEEEEDESDSDDDDEEDDDGNNEEDDSAIKLTSTTELFEETNEKKSFANRKQYLSIDSGHIQSESPSPVDLSPSSVSPLPPQVLSSTKPEPMSYSYFRAPCPKCGGSTYDDTSTTEIEKQFYHKTCLHCHSCEKRLKENEYQYHELTANGGRQFYCTLHYCKSRLKQVTTTLATATQQESRTSAVHSNTTQLRLNTNPQSSHSHQNLRLYPSLKDALSPKPHPLNVVNIPDEEQKHQAIGFEHINQSVSEQTFDRIPTTRVNDYDENFNLNSKSTTTETSKQRFKRRGQNRPSSPLPSAEFQSVLSTDFKQDDFPIESQPVSAIVRKKKKILLPQVNFNSSSSSTASSQSLEDERQPTSSDEQRRRQREERQKEAVRFRRSQEIQRELEEIEQKRLELDKRHALSRQNLNTSVNDEKKKAYWERDCLCIVREKTALQRSEEELSMAKRGLTLENERSRAEHEYRQLIQLPDERKTTRDKDREEQLLTIIGKLVEEKNRLTTDLDQMRLRELQEDEYLGPAYRHHGIDHQTTNFRALDLLKDII